MPPEAMPGLLEAAALWQIEAAGGVTTSVVGPVTLLAPDFRRGTRAKGLRGLLRLA